jgi:Arc/MetJ family transcription regulator
MKRTNVVLDDRLLEEAIRLSGERTYTATIHRALQEMVNRLKVRSGLAALEGCGMWEGELAEMRDDRPRIPARRWAPPKGVPVRTVADTLPPRLVNEAEREDWRRPERPLIEPKHSYLHEPPPEARPPKKQLAEPVEAKGGAASKRGGAGAKGRGGKRGSR